MSTVNIIKWACGHTTSIAYNEWPECPVCALEQGRFCTIERTLADRREQESQKHLREALDFSRTFNRQGCPYCGGIS